MEEVSNLLRPKVLSRLIEQLRTFRRAKGYGYIAFHIQDGRILTVGVYNSFKELELADHQMK